MRILFLNYETALGSAVHASAVFASLLKSKRPLEIDLLAGGIAYDVLKNHPVFYKTWKSPNPIFYFKEALIWAYQNRKQLRTYDKIIFNSGNCRTKTILFSYFLKTKSREGFAINNRLLNKYLVFDNAYSIIYNNLQVVKLVDDTIDLVYKPEVWYNNNDMLKSYNWVRGISEYDKRPIIGFFSGTSGGQPSNWFDDRFIDVAKRLIKELGAYCVFFGGKSDELKIKTISELVGSESLESLAGKTSIAELAAHVAVCDLIISVDTGGMHVSWAVDVPLLVIASAAQPKHTWLPLHHKNATVIRKDEKVACALCNKRFCATMECMQAISVSEVVNTAKYKLLNYRVFDRQVRLKNWVNKVDIT